jgi:hypothetical protein
MRASSVDLADGYILNDISDRELGKAIGPVAAKVVGTRINGVGLCGDATQGTHVNPGWPRFFGIGVFSLWK